MAWKTLINSQRWIYQHRGVQYGVESNSQGHIENSLEEVKREVSSDVHATLFTT